VEAKAAAKKEATDAKAGAVATVAPPTHANSVTEQTELATALAKQAELEAALAAMQAQVAAQQLAAATPTQTQTPTSATTPAPTPAPVHTPAPVAVAPPPPMEGDPLSALADAPDTPGARAAATPAATAAAAAAVTVMLDRSNGKKMGVRFGDAKRDCGVPIVSVALDGQAFRKLNEGDVVVKINGISVRGKTSKQAGELVKQSTRVELTMGDPDEDPVALRKTAKEAEKAEKQRLADEKSAEKKRIADEKGAEKKRIADEKAAEKQRIADEKAANKQAAADAKQAAKDLEEEAKSEAKRIDLQTKAEAREAAAVGSEDPLHTPPPSPPYPSNTSTTPSGTATADTNSVSTTHTNDGTDVPTDDGVGIDDADTDDENMILLDRSKGKKLGIRLGNAEGNLGVRWSCSAKKRVARGYYRIARCCVASSVRWQSSWLESVALEDTVGVHACYLEAIILSIQAQAAFRAFSRLSNNYLYDVATLRRYQLCGWIQGVQCSFMNRGVCTHSRMLLGFALFLGVAARQTRDNTNHGRTAFVQ
jgi:hypothetical protein